jgi:hypothetical protein
MAFQSEPAPTAPGMRSEPSKRNTAFGSCRISTDSLSTGFFTLATSSCLFAEIQSPSLAFSFTHSGEVKSWTTASVSGLSLKEARNSPPPRTGLLVASAAGK